MKKEIPTRIISYLHHILSAIAHKFLIVLSFGMILASFSEFWFYQINDDVEYFPITIIYGFLGYFFLMTLERYGVNSFYGFFIAAALFGFLVEGVPVSVLYSALPFTIIWTSLAWHTLLSVTLGWLFFKRAMHLKSWFLTLCFNIFLGVFLGLWNAYMWNVNEENDANEVSFTWHPIEPFIEQFLIGYCLFILGHILFERVYRQPSQYNTIEYFALAVLFSFMAITVGYASGLWIPFLTLPMLIILCLSALNQNRRNNLNQKSNFISDVNHKTIPISRYIFTIFIPICAIAVYSFILVNKIALEMNAILIIITGPLSLFLFVYSLFRVCIDARSCFYKG